jgi:hypothetical protein
MAVAEAGTTRPGLPAAYGTGRLLLVARDPRWLYAHWDLTEAQLVAYNRQSATGHLALRVFEKSLETPPVLEQEVHPESRNWFLNVPRTGTTYLAELGYRDRTGVWQRISTSGATLTPSEDLSGETWVRFETVPFEVSKEQLVALVKEATSEHPPLFEAVLESNPPLAASQPVAPEVRHRSEQFTAPITSGSGPAYATPTPRSAPGTPVWTPEKERALAELLSIDEVRRVWIGSLEITELLRRHLARGPSSAELPIAGQGAAEGAAAAGWSGISSLSSLSSPLGGGGEAGGKRGFRFEVNAELIVYGATEPDAEVTIGGRRIRLRPDGSFAYRFALPDGRYELPIAATSADALERRTADLTFSRGSEYQGGVGTHPQDSTLQPPSPENVA